MKPTTTLASTQAPDGTVVSLLEHDGDYTIRAAGADLMTSRQHASELALGRLGCLRLAENRNAVVLIGGVGMGYTLRAALDVLHPDARVGVAELLPAIVQWNRGPLAHLAGAPLDDPRVRVVADDLMAVLSSSATRYDAILLDVDNGPEAMVTRGNRRLYGHDAIATYKHALHQRGVLSVWSASPDTRFPRRLQKAGFAVQRFRVPAYAGSRGQFRCIWCASGRRHSLPPESAVDALPLTVAASAPAPGEQSDTGRPSRARPRRKPSRRARRKAPK